MGFLAFPRNSSPGISVLSVESNFSLVGAIPDVFGPITIDKMSAATRPSLPSSVFSLFRAFSDSTRIFASTGSSVRALTLSSISPIQAFDNGTALNFGRGNWATEIMSIPCSARPSDGCGWRPGLESLDFSNLMVSVVVILGVCMASGPLLLMYSEKQQKVSRHPPSTT